MSTRLDPLRSQLAGLRWRRWALRLAAGAAACALAACWTLAGTFLLDWLFEFSRGQRAVLLGGWVLVGAWGFRRFLVPAIVSIESELDVALAVERQQGIDGDLVAALQFESSADGRWGSAQLAAAVIDDVSARGKTLNVRAGRAADRLGHRLTALAVAAALLAAVAARFPHHAAAFLNRFF